MTDLCMIVQTKGPEGAQGDQGAQGAQRCDACEDGTRTRRIHGSHCRHGRILSNTRFGYASELNLYT